jgi:putative transposase
MDWPHAPVHRLHEAGTYMVTAGTYQKLHHFRSRARLDYLHRELLRFAAEYEWHLQAWAVFSNHYHFIAYSDTPKNLTDFTRDLHSSTSKAINGEDGARGRQVWYQFWDRQLTYPRSYYARLNYVHSNPVKHGLVKDAVRYPWCSASWFAKAAPPALVKTIRSFPTDRVRERDDFKPLIEEL